MEGYKESESKGKRISTDIKIKPGIQDREPVKSRLESWDCPVQASAPF